MRSFIFAALLAAMLATLVTADDDPRNCISICTGITDDRRVCAAYNDAGRNVYSVFNNACAVKQTNCFYPHFRKFI